MNSITAASIKTGLETRHDLPKWDREKWFDLFLCGKKVGTIVGKARAAAQLKGIAKTQGIDLIVARRAYVAAVEAEAARLDEIARLEAAAPDFSRATMVPELVSVPSDLEDQRTEQGWMFGCADKHGLDRADKDGMLAATNELFGWNYTSRSFWDALENRRVANAIRNGDIRAGWELSRNAKLRVERRAA